MTGKMTAEEEEEMYEAAIRSAGNMGPAQDMYHPDYGWILSDGELTEAGQRFFADQKKTLEKK